MRVRLLWQRNGHAGGKRKRLRFIESKGRWDFVQILCPALLKFSVLGITSGQLFDLNLCQTCIGAVWKFPQVFLKYFNVFRVFNRLPVNYLKMGMRLKILGYIFDEQLSGKMLRIIRY